MTSDHIFWFSAGAMSAIAAMALGFPLRQQLRGRSGTGRAAALAIAVAVVVIAGSMGLYRMWGTPGAISLSSKESALVSNMASAGGAASTTKVGSVEDATDKLAKRLAAKGGSSADWNLLSQSYEFLGRSADAAEARKRAGLPATAATTVSAAGTALLAQAEKQRIAHEYKKALDLYSQAAKLDALTADAWANYADAAASSSGGKLDGAPAQYLTRALQLDPNHPKALWLQASLLHEQKHYDQAAEVWRHLAAVLPSESSDAKIISANIAEALRLSQVSPAAQAANAIVQINGTIDIDPKLRAKAGAGQTLFIFAKAVGSPGPPLAVVRTAVGVWPIRFSLNDSQAMMPQRKLSDFEAVTVEARISTNGQPLAQTGDLHGVTGALDPKSGKPVHVVIREVIG